MTRTALLTALITLALGLSANADAKGRIRSSHGSGDTHAHAPQHASETHLGDGTSAGVRSALSRPGRSGEGNQTGDGQAAGAPLASEEDANLRRIRQEKEAARAKAESELQATRKLQQEADLEKRRQQAEQAALAAAEEQKRRDLEAKAKNRELALLERQKRQAAWEARCQIKAVMTDEEIATCKEVWSTPAR